MGTASDAMPTRPRGRPQAFSREDALDLAILEFRRSGYDGATMDQLALAMGITKPSIYRAFGDRKSLYRAAVKRYGEKISVYWRAVAEDVRSLEAFVPTFLGAAIDWFVEDGSGIRGCLVLSTMSHAVTHEDLAQDLSDFISSMEDDISSYLSATLLNDAADGGSARDVAVLLTAHAHSLATRARAGASEDRLRRDAAIMSRSVLALVQPSRRVPGGPK